MFLIIQRSEVICPTGAAIFRNVFTLPNPCSNLHGRPGLCKQAYSILDGFGNTCTRKRHNNVYSSTQQLKRRSHLISVRFEYKDAPFCNAHETKLVKHSPLRPLLARRKPRVQTALLAKQKAELAQVCVVTLNNVKREH